MTAKVKVYWNISKKLWSIMATSGPRKNRVIGHAESVRMHNVNFKVSKPGRERVLREGKKNVHAYAEGELIGVEGVEWKDKSYALTLSLLKPTGNGAAMVTYDPYKDDTFMSEGRAVRWASWAVFDKGKVYARWVEPYHPNLLLENDSVGIKDYYTH